MEQTKFIYFQTACGCQRMVPATPRWRHDPVIKVPLVYPLALHDWINDLTDDAVTPRSAIRTFRLEREEALEDGSTIIYTYKEVEG